MTRVMRGGLLALVLGCLAALACSDPETAPEPAETAPDPAEPPPPAAEPGTDPAELEAPTIPDDAVAVDHFGVARAETFGVWGGPGAGARRQTPLVGASGSIPQEATMGFPCVWYAQDMRHATPVPADTGQWTVACTVAEDLQVSASAACGTTAGHAHGSEGIWLTRRARMEMLHIGVSCRAASMGPFRH